jgi:ferredoxin
VKRAIQEAGKGGGAAAPTRRAREGAATPDRRARGGAAAPARGGAAAHSYQGEAAPTRGGEAAPTQGGAAACGGRACSYSKCSGCLLVSEVAPPGFRESCKGGRSSRSPTFQSPTADDRDGLRLQDQCLGWGAGERSAPPVYDDDDGGLDVSSSGSDSDSDGGAPPAATTSA